MSHQRHCTHRYVITATLVFLLWSVGSAHADTITWTQWTSNASPTAAKTGTMTFGSTVVDVTFQTANNSYSGAFSNWWGYNNPPFDQTFYDGNLVDNGPPWGGIQLFGGNLEIHTLTFSSPVINPAMSIISLGNWQMWANYGFFVNRYGAGTPFFVSGGGSTLFGGTSISTSASNVWGAEGNGTVIFFGTFTSLSWQNPVYEDWSGFTIGAAGVGVPEPSSITLIGISAFWLLCFRRRK